MAQFDTLDGAWRLRWWSSPGANPARMLPKLRVHSLLQRVIVRPVGSLCCVAGHRRTGAALGLETILPLCGMRPMTKRYLLT
jgi:hypothetical protein